jgi:hypothetical protein
MPQISVQIAETFPLVALSQTSVNKNHARRYRDCLVIVELLGKYVADIAKGLDEERVKKIFAALLRSLSMATFCQTKSSGVLKKCGAQRRV